MGRRKASSRKKKSLKGRTFGRASSQIGSKEKKQRTVWRYERHYISTGLTLE